MTLVTLRSETTFVLAIGLRRGSGLVAELGPFGGHPAAVGRVVELPHASL
jgi:hypothetical protein